MFITIFLASWVGAGVMVLLVPVLAYFSYDPTTVREFPLALSSFITGWLGYWMYRCADEFDKLLANEGLAKRAERINTEAQFWGLLRDHVSPLGVAGILREKARIIQSAERNIEELTPMGGPIDQLNEMKDRMESDFDALREFLIRQYPDMKDSLEHPSYVYYL